MIKIFKKTNGQVGLVACKPFQKDDVVIDLVLGDMHRKRNLRTIEIGPALHIDHFFARYTNHHCDPSCYVDKESIAIRAARDLRIGEEITFDYMANESEINFSFKCNCGASNCCGIVGTGNSMPSYLEQSSLQKNKSTRFR